MAQLRFSEPMEDNSSDTGLTEVRDSVHLLSNDPSSIRNQEKRHKIIVKNLIICAPFIITIATTILSIFFLINAETSDLHPSVMCTSKSKNEHPRFFRFYFALNILYHA
jgi:hypothetical protein